MRSRQAPSWGLGSLPGLLGLPFPPRHLKHTQSVRNK